MSQLKLTDLIAEIQYDEFVLFVQEHKLDEDCSMLNELGIPKRLKKIWGFIKELAEKVSFKLVDLVKLFRK